MNHFACPRLRAILPLAMSAVLLSSAGLARAQDKKANGVPFGSKSQGQSSANVYLRGDDLVTPGTVVEGFLNREGKHKDHVTTIEDQVVITHGQAQPQEREFESGLPSFASGSGAGASAEALSPTAITPAAVPEPGAVVTVGVMAGITGLAILRRRLRRKA